MNLNELIAALTALRDTCGGNTVCAVTAWNHSGDFAGGDIYRVQANLGVIEIKAGVPEDDLKYVQYEGIRSR